MSTATKPRTTFQSSELSRSSAEVFAAAADQPVHVTRRDGEPLVLMTESEDRARSELLALAGQLIAVATCGDGPLADRMADHFGWMLALSAEDRAAAADDILQAARASFATGQSHLAMAELLSWRETATALAAGLGHTPVEWLDEAEPVERP
ncbi:hypothetical protein [Nocardioides sp. GXZ039]|uniref:hypothetical protein n=1 Tax=Nocardioides sp. GXZ039 TaxID=3136018 RepID=UPI0030F4449F